ncbi:MAG: MG2 domain-containing protein [Steroidobacteraceae bacterium]
MFALRVDGAVDPAGLGTHAACEAEGITERLPLRIVAGAERARVLAGLRRQRWMLGELVNPDEPWKPVDAGALEGLLLVQCARPLPAGRAAHLVWDAGLASPAGVARSEAQRLDFKVRGAFLATTRCERMQPDAPCLPVGMLAVEFSAPVARAAALRVRLGDGQRSYAPRDTAALPPYVERLEFAGPFPARGTLHLEVPRDLVDESGRPLANAARFPLAIPLDAAPPLAKFAAEFGILERNAGPALPVTLRHLENPLAGGEVAVPGAAVVADTDAAIMAWLRRLNRAWDHDQPLLGPKDAAQPLSLPRNDTGTTQVIGIPLKSPGLHVVELRSPLLGAALADHSAPAKGTGAPAKGADAVYYVRAAALVTNLGVHLKIGRESSLVWVTTLDTATPVAGAAISVRGCDGAEQWHGTTDASGIARVRQPLREVRNWDACGGLDGFYASARAGDDVAFALSSWREGISSWDFNLPSAGYEPGPLVAHTVLDRALVRAGETVHMKHVVRRHDAGGLSVPAAKERPALLRISHVGSEEHWDVPLSFNAAGSAWTDWSVPRAAKLGRYQLTLMRGEVGDFRVAEFRLPTMRATLQLEPGPLVARGEVGADALVSYLAGGGAAGLGATLRWRVQGASVGFAGFEDYTFTGGAVRTGSVASFSDGADEEESDSGEGPAAAASPVHELAIGLDTAGALRTRLTGLEAQADPAELVAELEYPDANGQRLSVSTRARLWPAAEVVGIRAPAWPRRGEAFAVDAVVLDLEGKPLADRTVRIEAYRRSIYSYRKRLVGGFYAYENSAEVEKLKDLCEGRTDAAGRLRCTAQLDEAQQLILRAVGSDAAGRTAAASQSLWLLGVDAWWGGSDSERMDLVPAKRELEVGESAAIEARVPFRKSTALVTVEREGILDAFVTPLGAAQPRVSVPIRRGYSANVFVSVLAVRGRVAAPAPTAMVDLARPTFRLGYTTLSVGRAPHRMQVTVQADRKVYPTRGKAEVSVRALGPDGKPVRGAELAFAAVDEALLELAPNPSWQLLEAMLQPRSLEVQTATAQLQVIGKRHYGRKAAPPGGGGGALPTRELFDTLLSWQRNVTLDAEGRARLEVPLNDSLSAFRLVAIANAGDDLFGTGSDSVTTHRDLMLFAGLPEHVREGDAEQPTVTVRNAGAVPLEVTVSAVATPIAADGHRYASVAPPPQSVQLAAGAARELVFPFPVPGLSTSIEWQFQASAPGVPGDALKLQQRVSAWPGPPAVYQSTLQRVDQPRRVSVARPRDALAGRGGVRVVWSPSLAGSLAGVRDYMQRYPYDCLEQRVSRAVALHDAAAWQAIGADLPTLLDADGLARYFPADWLHGSDVLTAYVLAIAQESGAPLPEEARTRMLDALEALATGKQAYRGLFRPGDDTLRRLITLEALARYGRVTPAMLEPLSVQPELWPTSALLDWYSIHLHATTLPGREARLAAADALLRNRLVWSATRLGFGTEARDGLWWLLRSPDENAARALLLTADLPAWREDAPRLASGTIARQLRGHWDTTLANAWGTLAMQRYVARFENEPVAGSSSAALGGTPQALQWSAPAAATPGNAAATTAQDFPWPANGRGDLTLTHQGSGAPWAIVQASAAIPLRQPLAAGLKVTRVVESVQAAAPGRYTRGDLLRVKLTIEAPQDLTWVVLDDPVPAGASVVGGLRNNGAPLGLKSAAQDLWPAFTEAGFENYRAYFDLLPRGTWHVEYLLRLNAAGEFRLPPTRAEAMYAPDIFGARPNPIMTVAPAAAATAAGGARGTR